MMKLGLRFVPPIAFVLQRFTVSVIVLLPVFLIMRSKIPRDRSTLGRLMILCMIFVSIIVAQSIGLAQESSGISAVITYTQPLFVFCLAIPFLRERVTATKLLGVLVGFTGVVVLFMEKRGSRYLNSSLIMLLGAFMWAVAVVYYKRYLSHVDVFITHFLQLLVGLFPLIILSLATSSLVVSEDTSYAMIVLYSSIGALAIGNVVWLHLLREEEATTLSGSSLVIPVVALLFGWQLLGENLSAWSLIGSALTLGGVCLINLSMKS